MPRYLKDINFIVPRQLAESMIVRAKRNRDKLIVALLYVSGARPTEVLKLNKGDIYFEDDNIIIKLQTLKLGKGGSFRIVERLLTIKPSFPFFHVIGELKDVLPIGISLRRVEQIVEELSDKKLCPYNFRHTRMTKLARMGATIDMLMYWKGSMDTRSVGAYLRGKKVEFDKIE